MTGPVTILGITQILAWGTSFYIAAVFAAPIAAETGWPLTWIVGGTSVGLLTAGLASRGVGRAIHRFGGRPVLMASSLLFALGLGVLSQAHHLAVFYAAWVVLGLGMGAGLYDAAFSTLGRIYGEAARRPITALTLWGGFASTVFWPISAYLIETAGWRDACLVYVGVHLLLGLPLHALALPRERALPALPPAAASGSATQATRSGLFLILATTVTLGAALVSITHIHLLTILQAQGATIAAAVALGALVGPAQVGARIVEIAFGSRYHPIWTMGASAVAMALGLAALWLAPAAIVAAAIVLYGGGVGIQSIARGTVPLAIYGKERYALVIGAIAMPALVAQAVSPTLAALLLDAVGVSATLGVLTGIAVVVVVLVVALGRRAGGAT